MEIPEIKAYATKLNVRFRASNEYKVSGCVKGFADK